MHLLRLMFFSFFLFLQDESPIDVEVDSETSEISLENDCNSDSEDVSEPNIEKLLIFTTGSKTYTPHQIGEDLALVLAEKLLNLPC